MTRCTNMLAEPKCFSRGCRWFRGVDQPDGTEQSEIIVCEAFPNGIPHEIAYGDNLHVSEFPGDHRIRFEFGESLEES